MRGLTEESREFPLSGSKVTGCAKSTKRSSSSNESIGLGHHTGSGSQFHSTQACCHTTQTGCSTAHSHIEHLLLGFRTVVQKPLARKLLESPSEEHTTSFSVSQVLAVWVLD
ncbi:hypothetical protein QQP08_002770 [Theobroma cacao]|nr:hypothetical protein QQP08_002770 [Theobroma cacao]